MFIKKLHKDILKRIDNGISPAYREQNIGWPSEALADIGTFRVGECKRALFYKIMGIAQSGKMSPRVRKICDVGLLLEDKAIQTFKNTLYHVDSQVRIQYEMPNTTNKVMLSGKIDEIIKDGITKGIEIKTVYGWKANSIFGGNGKQPLPASENLMQAMLYKHKAMNEQIGEHSVDEIYLMYINREDGCEMYFKIDINETGYPVITPITMEGVELPPIDIQAYPSFDNVLQGTKQSMDAARYSELRININDIFTKFDSAFSYARAGMLPDKDYSLVYTREQMEQQYHCGKASKIKYNKHMKGEQQGDFKCMFCNYQSKCLEDDGVRLK